MFLARYFQDYFWKDVKTFFGWIFAVIMYPLGIVHYVLYVIPITHKIYTFLLVPIIIFSLGFIGTNYPLLILLIIALLKPWMGYPLIMLGFVYMMAI